MQIASITGNRQEEAAECRGIGNNPGRAERLPHASVGRYRTGTLLGFDATMNSGGDLVPSPRETKRIAQIVDSIYTDPELTDWIRWASESGDASSFINAIAEEASIADLPNYALLRPVLLKLKRESAEAASTPSTVV